MAAAKSVRVLSVSDVALQGLLRDAVGLPGPSYTGCSFHPPQVSPPPKHMAPHPLLLAAAAALAASSGAPNYNPLAGLAALPKVHHSFGMCNHWTEKPSAGCPFPVDSSSPLQQDFARITHAWVRPQFTTRFSGRLFDQFCMIF